MLNGIIPNGKHNIFFKDLNISGKWITRNKIKIEENVNCCFSFSQYHYHFNPKPKVQSLVRHTVSSVARISSLPFHVPMFITWEGCGGGGGAFLGGRTLHSHLSASSAFVYAHHCSLNFALDSLLIPPCSS